MNVPEPWESIPGPPITVKEEVDMKPDVGEISSSVNRQEVTGARKCCVGGCPNASEHSNELEGKTVSFYGFPNARLRREQMEKWIYFVVISRQMESNSEGMTWKPKQDSFICGDHFVGGENSRDPNDANFNPTILPRSRSVNVNGRADANYSTPGGIRTPTNEPMGQPEDKAICTICTSKSRTRSTAKAYLLYPNFTKFIDKIFNSEGTTSKFLDAMKSFGIVTICEDCLAAISTVVNQDAEIHLMEGEVRKLQLQLLWMLQHLQDLVKGYCVRMDTIKSSITNSNEEEFKEVLVSEQVLHHGPTEGPISSLGFGGRLEGIMELRKKILEHTENIQRQSGWQEETLLTPTPAAEVEGGDGSLEIGDVKLMIVNVESLEEDGAPSSEGPSRNSSDHLIENSRAFILPDLEYPPPQPPIHSEPQVSGTTSNGGDSPSTKASRKSGGPCIRIAPKLKARLQLQINCDICGKDVSKIKSIYRRYRHHKACVAGRTYKCDRCPKAFNRTDNLHRHKLSCQRNSFKYLTVHELN